MRRPGSRQTTPASSGISPAMAFNRLDLPLPLRPMTAMRSPGSIRRSAASRSGRWPKARCAFWRWTIGTMDVHSLPFAVGGSRSADGIESVDSMELRTFNIGCFGGGTGLPSLLGGLKRNPWLTVNAVVTMFDSGGSSGMLRDQLGVLPPGDVLKCACALARNEREARRVLLARLPTLEHARLGGHTGGNLLLSMMQQYSGDFLAAVDGLRGLLDCAGRVWPISVEQSSVCAAYADGTVTRGEVEVDAAQSHREITKIWLEPEVHILPAAADAIARFEAAIIGPGSFYTSLMPNFLVKGAPEAVRHVRGPIVLVTNLLTEGRGMKGFTAASAVR